MPRSSSVVAILLALAACGGEEVAGPSETPPQAPAENDPAYTINALRNWYLIGNDLTPGQDELVVQVNAPKDVGVVDMWLDGQPGVRLLESEQGFAMVLDISATGPGEHELLFAADGSDVAFARTTFLRSHPLYVVLGTDWDDPDNTEAQWAFMEELHANHAELEVTHFVGPYTFTAPEMTPERIDFVVNWLKDGEATYGNETAVHIHPYCNFVDTTTVTCRTTPSCVYIGGDSTGYTVISAAYTEEQYTILLQAADALFTEHGFDKPTAFRAGAWTSDVSTLKAQVNAGYTVNSDAWNWQRMEEWIGQGNGVFYEWVEEHWWAIDDSSQPYYPSDEDPSIAGEPALPILEVPMNGAMADYATADEMIEIFGTTWPGGALDAPAVYVVGYHPGSLDNIFFNRIDDALDNVDQFLISNDAGPALYTTISSLTQVFPQ